MNAEHRDVETDHDPSFSQLQQENVRLLDELETIYRQFILLRRETDISYAQLRARNQELEKKVNELERAYNELEEAENQLIHSERLAAMGQLAASIVHELSSPLTVISGYIELLLMRSPLSDSERRILKIAQEHASSMTGLVREILLFSHKQAAPFGLVNVNEVIDYVVTFLANLIKKQVVTINRSLTSDLPPIIGSPQQIQQVFINIIRNAADAMERQGILSIETECVDAETVARISDGDNSINIRSLEDIKALCEKYTQFIITRFKDNGPGISPDTLDNIFNPFFTTKPAEKGTGLGLSICRTIIERHDGNILVSSVVDQGTTFTVLLPARSIKQIPRDFR